MCVWCVCGVCVIIQKSYILMVSLFFMVECKNKFCHNPAKFMVKCQYTEKFEINAEICEFCAVEFRNLEDFNQKLIPI
jgi:hypothetical protein